MKIIGHSLIGFDGFDNFAFGFPSYEIVNVVYLVKYDFMRKFQIHFSEIG